MRVRELEFSGHAIEALAEDAQSPERARSVLADPNYKVFANRSRAGRWYLVGRVPDGPVLVLILAEPGSDGTARVVTSWIASGRYLAMYQQSGGSQYVET